MRSPGLSVAAPRVRVALGRIGWTCLAAWWPGRRGENLGWFMALLGRARELCLC